MPQHTHEGRSQLIGAGSLPPCEIPGPLGWPDGGDTFTCWAPSPVLYLGFPCEMSWNCTLKILHFVGIVNRPGCHQLHPHTSLSFLYLPCLEGGSHLEHPVWSGETSRISIFYRHRTDGMTHGTYLGGSHAVVWLFQQGLSPNREPKNPAVVRSVGPARGWTS